MRWLRRLFQKSRADKELDRELQFHLERQIADHTAAGISPEGARRRANLEFGGLERVKEEVRDTRWETHLENLFIDFRYALRGLRNSPAFSLIAILALSLGIGASTIVFSVIYNVFFDALPYKAFKRSVVLEMRNLENVGGWKNRNYFFPDEVRAFREQNHVLEDVIAYVGARVLYDNGKSSSYWPFGAVVTANTFDYLGVPALLGRTLSPEDGNPGAPPVMVMNYRFWQQQFGGDPKILGKIFVLDGNPTALVGIMPPRFNAFEKSFWLPATPDKSRPSLLGGATVMGRLRPGVSLRTAAADLDTIAHHLQMSNPDGSAPKEFAVVPRTLLDTLIGDFKKTLYALVAAVLLLLLIACSNVASLLLARASTREREIATRATLGATRGRLIRQLLMESLVLAAAAAVAGCVSAYFGLRVVIALIPAGTLPQETMIHLNAPVLLLSLGLTLLTTLLCGLVPAFHLVRSDLQPRLNTNSKGVGGGFRHGELRSGLVVIEVALSIVLLIGAGLLMRSFFVLTHVDLGFDSRNIGYFRLDLPATYNTDVPHSRDRKNALTRHLLDRLRALPGVISVAESMDRPPLNYDFSDTIIPGKPHSERWETRYEMCSEGFFPTLGIPLLSGRFFSEDDVTAARDVMVVNEAFSRQYFPNEDPIGHKVKLEVLDRPFLDTPHNTYFEIIGIVGDYKTRTYDHPSWEDFPGAFIPYSVQGSSWRTFMFRTATDPGLLLKNVGQEVSALDPAVRIADAGTLEGSLHEFYRGPQFELVTLAAFAAFGLLLVVIGIFSVMAYTVSLRTHEIGIRMALGAQHTNILRLVLLNGLRLVTAGVLIGLLTSAALTRFLASQISGVSVTDPWTLTAAVVLIMLVGLAACLLPARRATRVDPLVALRYE
jgi:putative ABC transport system permease protein